MPEQKTKPTDVRVESYLAELADERKRADSQRLCELMSVATGEPPVMWGPSIIGFGSYHYRYESGHEGDTPLVAFAPRAKAFSLYLNGSLEDYEPILAKLGKYKTGKGCLYITRLSDVDEEALDELIRDAVARVRATNA